jgi:hypothetical protein
MASVVKIPVEFSPEETARRLRFSPGRAGFASVEDFVDFARPLIDFKAVYDVAYLGSKEEETTEVEVPGVARVVFKSRVLRRNLDRAQKAFPYIMTLGPELERVAVSSGDLLRQYYLEELANIVLDDGVSWLSKSLEDRWGMPNLSNMNPGSLEDWPLEEQPKLFSLFGETDHVIGVRLTENHLMLPRKSLSGILFPSEEDFHACRLCAREKCPSRRAPYEESAAAEFASGSPAGRAGFPASSKK